MSFPKNVPELTIPDSAVASKVEVAQFLEQAATMVQDFTRKSGTAALDAVLSASRETPLKSVKQSGKISGVVARQSKKMDDEVARFLSLTRP